MVQKVDVETRATPYLKAASIGTGRGARAKRRGRHARLERAAKPGGAGSDFSITKNNK